MLRCRDDGHGRTRSHSLLGAPPHRGTFRESPAKWHLGKPRGSWRSFVHQDMPLWRSRLRGVPGCLWWELRKLCWKQPRPPIVNLSPANMHVLRAVDALSRRTVPRESVRGDSGTGRKDISPRTCGSCLPTFPPGHGSRAWRARFQMHFTRRGYLCAVPAFPQASDATVCGGALQARSYFGARRSTASRAPNLR